MMNYLMNPLKTTDSMMKELMFFRFIRTHHVHARMTNVEHIRAVSVDECVSRYLID